MMFALISLHAIVLILLFRIIKSEERADALEKEIKKLRDGR